MADRKPGVVGRVLEAVASRVEALVSPICICDDPYPDPDDPEPFCWRCRRPMVRDEDEA